MKNLKFFVFGILLLCGTLVSVVWAQEEAAPPLPPMPPAMEAPPPVDSMPFAPPSEDPNALQPPPIGDDQAPAMQLNQDYIYDPAGRRDPFKAYGQSQNTQMPVVPKEDGEKPAPAPTDPLQMYDISQFRLVGIIWQVKKPKAVVRDPVGKMHMIYRDTKIGRNNGFVASIREGEVLVVEPTIGENGMPSAITRSMALKK